MASGDRRLGVVGSARRPARRYHPVAVLLPGHHPDGRTRRDRFSADLRLDLAPLGPRAGLVPWRCRPRTPSSPRSSIRSCSAATWTPPPACSSTRWCRRWPSSTGWSSGPAVAVASAAVVDGAELADPADLLPGRLLQRPRPERKTPVPVPRSRRCELLAVGGHHDRGLHRGRLRCLGGRAGTVRATAAVPTHRTERARSAADFPRPARDLGETGQVAPRTSGASARTARVMSTRTRRTRP